MQQSVTFYDVDSKMDALRTRLENVEEEVLHDFHEKLLVSWIYHDNALEGVVLSYHELKAAIDDRIISDNTLIPLYDEIRQHKQAIDFIRSQASKRRLSFSMTMIKKLHHVVTGDEDPTLLHYRKENPLHRVYFHEIAAPEKISYRMRRIVEWIKSDEYKKSHPIMRAAYVHQTLITIFPWVKNSGKVARLLMNLLLLRDGYVPAIIHAVDRQRYYDVLRAHTPNRLAVLIREALLNGIDSVHRYITEFVERRENVA
jgi:Fic family protein